MVTYIKELKRIAIGVLGQSNERGNVALTDLASYPLAFGSLQNPAAVVPIGPSVSIAGGWWHYVYDALRDYGYEPEIVQGSIGSLSYVKHLAGQMSFSNRSAGYYRKRAPAGYPDRGYAGDLICPNGNRVFRATVGRDIAAVNAAPFLSIGSTATNLDYINFVGAQNTAASAPDFSTANVGDTVVDGGITWTCEATSNGAYGGAGGTIFTEGQNGLGFDPFGVIARLHEDMQRVRDVERKIIYLGNAQSDLSNTQAWYQASLVSIANFFLNRGYEVMMGLSCFSPGSGSTAQYDTLTAALAGAKTTLRAGNYSSKVLDGANLYSLMGSTGPMASGGAYMQGDNVHLNGAGAVGPAVSGVQCAGYHVANALKAVLTDRRPLVV